ncbi:MAG: tRNA pseudouridine(13) synthase TruD [Phycisphaerae bacterium]|nr:tRNA pseudouridine(13) synthase TruD [Phycisphaerae bacterium]HOL26343.1 tRNA pseudouridine(13) synthase TruD [Phycisphaerae bacterium]HQA45637.1 tRNA pseudouridine(13) synthase TruD [Phycisphaerae bacterium]HQE44818.1 tRNA pseudouridine(13) synthase TruD [Phycisphaerae bacterium]HXK86159.1 tRNA pseudouridine(13) synthase TruD [Phycisphaerae bacterium]
MINVNELPYLTASIPGIGGRIKTRPEDFFVDEVPLYPAAGEGTHTYFKIEKMGLATMQAVQQIARALGKPAYEIGYAGLKDADALTRQWLSVEHVDPARVQSLDVPRVRVIEVTRHGNKLKLGHLAGNRFRIKVRQIDPARAREAQATMEMLAKRGVPNYFGAQRFGSRGDTGYIGRAILRRDFAEALALMLGRPGPHDYGQVRRARELFEAGDYEEAARTWPYPFFNEKRICRMIIKYKGNAERVIRAVDKQMRRFYISAYQSLLFNQIVAARLETLDRLMAGDLAWKHANGAVFKVVDPAVEQPRCDAFEISPTGPLYGHRMSRAEGEPGQIEQALLDSEDTNPNEWREGPTHKVRGGRRPLRFRPQEASVTTGQDDAGPYIELAFQLEPGCYATAVLREICKAEESLSANTSDESTEPEA